jgi:L-ribulose-5-phosphate 3-epimerase
METTYARSRRTFLRQAVFTAGLLPLMPASLLRKTGADLPAVPKVHIFSKHLQFLNYAEVAEAAAEMGFDGVDLTVRPNGHVLPERVETDLPKAVDALKKVGLSPLMMTTAVEDARNPTDKRVLETAAGLGMRCYRMNWYRYPEQQSLPAAISEYQQKIKELSQLNKKLKLVGAYQNHAGKLVGASVWEIWQMLQGAEAAHMGVQYDIRHATVEGGLSWENGLRLLQPHIKILAIKDFRWEKSNGKWGVLNTPIGEGMVDFPAYFKLLKQYQIQVPISLHLEYPLEGAEHGATKISGDPKLVFAAMKRDLQKVKELWEQA